MLTLREDESRLISITDVRKILNMGKTSNKVYDFVRENNIKYIIVGNKWQVYTPSLYDYVNKQFGIECEQLEDIYPFRYSPKGKLEVPKDCLTCVQVDEYVKFLDNINIKVKDKQVFRSNNPESLLLQDLAKRYTELTQMQKDILDVVLKER